MPRHGTSCRRKAAVTLIDVSLHRRGLASADQFVQWFDRLDIPRVAHRGELTRAFLAEVRVGRFGTGEGVVCEGGAGHGRSRAKAKTDAYLRRLKEAAVVRSPTSWMHSSWSSK